MTNFLSNTPNPKFSKELPADENIKNYSRQVENACFSYANTKIPAQPQWIHLSTSFAKELGIDFDNSEDELEILSGAKPFADFKPYAMCYGGHQFGNWAGQLGDGRAINIAEINLKGKNWKFQLKGAGPTPFSRSSDGLAVLRSSIREYLCSEAMHHLGIATTRALSLVKTGDLVLRDILYNGNAKNEQGAIVCRVSESFIRFGNFEILTARKDIPLLKQLTDYTIKHHFSHLGEPSKETYLSFFNEVAKKTKTMIVHWQRVGFVHGVMNTDNMSILGQTIDYGPYGWLEDYDPGWTPNTTDAQYKRYRYGNQAHIALWNLTQLANALYPLINDAEPLQEILSTFKKMYLLDYHKMMNEKLGLYAYDIVSEKFILSLTEALYQSEVDMTLFFRNLSSETILDFDAFWEMLKTVSYLDDEKLEADRFVWMDWFTDFAKLVKTENVDPIERKSKMKLVNPKYVLRNYMAQLAIDDAEKGDYKLVNELYQLLLKPYDEQPKMEKWFAKRPDWARHKVGCSMLSCSS